MLNGGFCSEKGVIVSFGGILLSDQAGSFLCDQWVSTHQEKIKSRDARIQILEQELFNTNERLRTMAGEIERLRSIVGLPSPNRMPLPIASAVSMIESIHFTNAMSDESYSWPKSGWIRIRQFLTINDRGGVAELVRILDRLWKNNVLI
ncbi:MAG: hypothetical protein ACLQPD_31170 [Desulfomonilaceae bacterium]